MMTRDFALRWAKYLFEQVGERYSAIYVRPVLATFAAPSRRTTYADVAAHFAAELAAEASGNWTFVPYSGGPPEVQPHVKTGVLSWTNEEDHEIGPFAWLAIYGLVPPSSTEELLWIQALDAPAMLLPGDVLRLPNGVRFWLDNV